jgi:AhpD family alkylhydroperoxidase
MGKRTAQLNEFLDGMRSVSKSSPEKIRGFNVLLNSEISTGAMDVKTKELICIAIACYSRCEYCIVYHAHECIKAGATREEIMEAAMVSVVFGGGPSMSFIATVLKQTLDEFINE